MQVKSFMVVPLRPAGWLNRFAAGADATVAFTQEAARLVKDMKTEISGLAVSGYGWLKSSFARAFQPATAPAAEPSAGAMCLAPLVL